MSAAEPASAARKPSVCRGQDGPVPGADRVQVDHQAGACGRGVSVPAVLPAIRQDRHRTWSSNPDGRLPRELLGCRLVDPGDAEERWLLHYADLAERRDV